jgi:hypothetical protein
MGQLGRTLLLGAVCGVLAGCSGGGGGDDDTSIEVTDDGRVLAGSDPIRAPDYVGLTFPLIFASSQDGAVQATTGTGRGSVEVVDADTIIVTLPGLPTRTFDRISDTEFSDAFGDVLTVEDFGSAQYLFQSAGNPGGDFLGTYGFETPVAGRPVTARYGGTSASVIVFAPEGSPGWIGFGGGGTLDLIATFDGSGGRIEGTLIDTDGFVDFFEDGTADDRFFIRTTLDGTIDQRGFSGTVKGDASVDPAGLAGRDTVNLALSDTTVDGKFFGPEADVASGSYAGNYTMTPAGAPADSGTLSGFFVAGQ